MEYRYNKKENKFIENGHTMFERDVLQRLKRLAFLEEQVKEEKLFKNNVNKTSTPQGIIYKKGRAYQKQFDTSNMTVSERITLDSWFFYGWRKHEEYLRDLIAED